VEEAPKLFPQLGLSLGFQQNLRLPSNKFHIFGEWVFLPSSHPLDSKCLFSHSFRYLIFNGVGRGDVARGGGE
jgi:hypothetical protein